MDSLQQLQTVTVTFKLPGRDVNLPRLAAQLRQDGEEYFFLISMNFYSGAVVIIDLKRVAQRIKQIRWTLIKYINPHRLRGVYDGR